MATTPGIKIGDIEELFRSISKTAETALIEGVLWNQLSAVELRHKKFYMRLREQVQDNHDRILEEEAQKNLDADGMTPMTTSNTPWITKEDVYNSLSYEADWVDVLLQEGSMIRLLQVPTDHFFGNIHKLDTLDAGLDYAVFLGWLKEEIPYGKEQTMRVYTQKWLIGEKVHVQNLPTRCYQLIKRGDSEETATFWDPALDFVE